MDPDECIKAANHFEFETEDWFYNYNVEHPGYSFHSFPYGCYFGTGAGVRGGLGGLYFNTGVDQAEFKHTDQNERYKTLCRTKGIFFFQSRFRIIGFYHTLGYLFVYSHSIILIKLF